MIGNLLRGLGSVSIFVLAAVLLFAYANLPDQVLVLMSETGEPLQYIPKNLFFYAMLSASAVINIALIYLARLVKSSQHFKSMKGWIWILVMMVNMFLMISITFISILNGEENFDYSNFGYLVYVGLGFLVLWVAGATIRYLAIKISLNVEH